VHPLRPISRQELSHGGGTVHSAGGVHAKRVRFAVHPSNPSEYTGIMLVQVSSEKNSLARRRETGPDCRSPEPV
jgi:hypothetical protein